MTYKERRRAHGLLLEKAVLDELVYERVLEPIKRGAMRRYLDGNQKYFISKEGSSEQPLDEVCNIKSALGDRPISSIIEVKCMRALNWTDFVDHRKLHPDKLVQHKQHMYTAKVHGIDACTIIALNKDSSEIFIYTTDINGYPIDDYCYEY